jgi:hypothetical protein
MSRVLTAAFLIALTLSAAAAAAPREVARWIDAGLPSTARAKDREVWLSAANWSTLEWRVEREAGRVVAEPRPRAGARVPASVGFLHNLARFGRIDAYTRVKDGWLVAFNRGGTDAGLYWFNHDGARNERISGQHVGGFFEFAGATHAIEGSTAPGMHEGSVIRIARDAHGRWRTSRYTGLPNTPEAVSTRPDGSVLITLSDAVVGIDADGRLHGVLSDAPWQSLYPNSSVLSADARHLYIGMRQYVADLDLASKRLRFLIPDRDLLHRLSAQDEQKIRGGLELRIVRAGGR